MNHSIFGAAAHILRGDVAVAYSGDLRQERRFDEGVRKSGKGGVRPYHPGDPRRAGRSSRRRDDRCEAPSLAPSPQYRPGGLLGGQGGGRQAQPRLREGVSRLGTRISGRSDLGHRRDRSGPDRPTQRRGRGSPIASRTWCWRRRGWRSSSRWGVERSVAFFPLVSYMSGCMPWIEVFNLRVYKMFWISRSGKAVQVIIPYSWH